jgi:mannosyl-oligosaccharide glucosidase
MQAGGDGAGEAEAERERVAAFLHRAWPRLEAWFGWFSRTQAGQLPGSYR